MKAVLATLAVNVKVACAASIATVTGAAPLASMAALMPVRIVVQLVSTEV